LLPLNIKQVRSMQASQALQPKIKEIQRKYKATGSR
jgi:membrane protein insertase Oxa1/YidC/SpoIIIJ